jgi:hypothetical protein
MITSRKLLIRFLFIAIGFSILVQLAEATSMTITVYGGKEETKMISLAAEDRVLIRFVVVGQSDSSVHFYITYPNGTEKDFDKIGDFHDSFVCNAEGECVFRFSNTDSTEDKLVTLNYEIEHYIFGIPQMLFLTIIIVVVCVAAVAVFILVGKPR